MVEHKLLSKTQELEIIYTKIELILDIMASQINKKKQQKRLMQIFKVTKMKKYKNGKKAHRNLMSLRLPYIPQSSRHLLHEINNYHNSLSEFSHSTSVAT